ncbi:uncharacterized protein MYCFIDRAFT_206881 [Pseudocercospora fijiensis CIRAD86]|uniref:Uncharacterized protein n=1 Tax=Pseudocercospora fijiensis (strain CIRAD86) TaxID=383855 RepID=M3BBF0_PSEFD|nr:uncharacterized protein MYCFIDRAFT_206881 [Pseudocercospora fijiensis CIRAD86]EME86622.1 hypothetical protein MYCFIDRAFT_206881 [Pseudocercospora fijiensis CIRAD86]
MRRSTFAQRNASCGPSSKSCQPGGPGKVLGQYFFFFGTGLAGIRIGMKHFAPRKRTTPSHPRRKLLECSGLCLFTSLRSDYGLQSFKKDGPAVSPESLLDFCQGRACLRFCEKPWIFQSSLILFISILRRWVSSGERSPVIIYKEEVPYHSSAAADERPCPSHAKKSVQQCFH